MVHRGPLEQARRVFFGGGRLEEERNFEATLAELAGTGLQWGGLLGIVGIFILVPVNVVLLDRPTAWWYSASMGPEAFVLWDKAVVAVLCGGAVWVGRSECGLAVSRSAGGALALLVAVVSLVHDAYRGVLSVEYVILIYLLAVAVIPYRPWQTLLLGGALSGIMYGLGRAGVPGTAASGPALVEPGHLVRMGFVTVVLTGVSTLLYVVRYRQYRAQEEAEALHEQVARLDRAKSRFFADLSHEFRTPLTLILGPLQEIRAGQLGDVPDALRRRLAGVEEQARRMKRLVDQLFDLASLDEGDLALTMRKHDLEAVVREGLPPLRQWAEEKALDFRLEGASESIEVWVDAERLRQVLDTVLSNAIRYTPQGGRVRVRVGRADGFAEIAVRDTGPGVPDALRDRVFGQEDSYIPIASEARPESDDGREAERWIGMGIGLAHARALVRRHGGHVEVESESGFGTELILRLPLGRKHVSEEDVAGPEEGTGAVDFSAEGRRDRGRAATATPGTVASAEEADVAPADAPEVLVVDDEAEMRTYLRALLGADYQVVTASDGEEAIERLRERSDDLVVSDVGMPGMGGVALCRAIRDDEQLRHLPVLLITARPEDRTRRPDLEAGADAYVSKPFDPDELAARVENLIEIRRIVQDRVRLPDWMESEETTVSSEDADFVEALNEVVDEHIDNSNFGVDWLADEMNLSARHLRRRIKETTGLSASGFIRTRRLQHAASLLREGADTISGVATAVGYRDPNYFSRLFRETFGCSPTEYTEREANSSEKPDNEA